jgi:hypothetical protein
MTTRAMSSGRSSRERATRENTSRSGMLVGNIIATVISDQLTRKTKASIVLDAGATCGCV